MDNIMNTDEYYLKLIKEADEQLNFREYRSMYYVNVLGGRKKILSFMKKMYKDKGNLYLERKYARIQSEIS